MNLAEKILAAHCGKKKVVPGEFINCKADVILSNDITAPIAIKEFRKIGVKKVFDPKKIVMVADHFVPNKDITSAEQSKFMREFALEQAKGRRAGDGEGRHQKQATRPRQRLEDAADLFEIWRAIVLLHVARARGMSFLGAQVQADNAPMLGIFRRHGGRVKPIPGADAMEVFVPTAPP